jgi:hypothetical protein
LGAFLAGLGVAEIVVVVLERRKVKWQKAVEKARGSGRG